MNLSLPFKPERRRLVLGHMPLADAAPLLWAAERGYFAAAGLDVRLACEVSWASLRDRLAYGALDAAQCLAPMPVAATLGADGVGVPMVSAVCLSQGGSGITFSRSLARRIGLSTGMGPLEAARTVAAFVAGGGRLRLAHVFAFSMHHYLLRDWLSLGGLSPDSPRVEFVVAPPPQMVRLLESGTVDGFCVGEPWNTAAVLGGLGVVVLSTHQVWDGGPEKVLGVTREWAGSYPQTHRALVAAVLAARRELVRGDRCRELARLMVEQGVLAVPEAWAESAFRGEVSGCVPRFGGAHTGFLRHSQLLWCTLQMLRLRQWRGPVDTMTLTAQVCDAAAYRDAAAALGEPLPDTDSVQEGGGAVHLGADGRVLTSRFLSGPPLDPANPAAYLRQRGWPETEVQRVLHAV